MRRPRFGVFNFAQSLVTLAALLFGIYGLMQAGDRPANSPRVPVATPCAAVAAPEVKRPPAESQPSKYVQCQAEPKHHVDVPLEPRDGGNGCISGTVTYTNGNAAADMPVSARNAAVRVSPPAIDPADIERSRKEYDLYFQELARKTRTTHTDGSGRFSFTGVDENLTYSITVGNRELGQSSQNAQNGADLKFTLEVPVFLDGLVERLDGGDMAGFTVTVEAQKGAGWYPVSSAAFSDAKGQFRIKARLGKVRVTAYMQGVIQESECVVDVPAEGGRVELRLNKAATLCGTVTSSDGAALGGATVMIVGQELPALGGGEGSDEPGVAPPVRRKSVRSGTSAPESDTAEKLERVAALMEEIQAKDEAEAKRKEKEETVKDLERRSRPAPGKTGYGKASYAVQANAKGEYRLDGLKPGSVTVLVTLGKVKDTREITLVSGENRADFSLDVGCRVRINARNTKGETVKPVYANFQKADGSYLPASPLSANEQGQVDYIGLPEGSCVILASVKGYAPARLEVVLGRGLNTFELALQEPAKIKGRVSTSGGRVPKDVYVRVVPQNEEQDKNQDKRKPRRSFEQYLTLDEKGNFASQDLAPGPYELRVDTHGQECLHKQTVNVTSGEQTVDIMIDEGCSLTITVRLDGIKADEGLSVMLGKANDEEGRTQRSAQLDASSKAEIMFLTEGEYYVMVYAPDAAQSWTPVTVRRGSNAVEITVGKSNCVKIMGIAPESQGAKAGLLDGDLIIEYNGKAITTLQQLVSEIQAAANQESVTIVIVRNGATQSFTLKGGKIGIGGQDWHR